LTPKEAQMTDVNAAAPAGDVYDWYTRGMRLLASRDAAAAAALLEHAARAEPTSCSVREGLARALFDSGRYADARAAFAANVEESPADDYAHFGLGLSHVRMGQLDEAVEHLAIAVALRPENHHYSTALRSARASRERG
jgi:Flp pilus assembly protein TadD